MPCITAIANRQFRARRDLEIVVRLTASLQMNILLADFQMSAFDPEIKASGVKSNRQWIFHF
jgi:hypothetical protein